MSGNYLPRNPLAEWVGRLALKLMGWRIEGECRDIHRIGDHRDAFGRHAPRHDVAAQALADGGHLIGEVKGNRLQSPRHAIAQAAFRGRPCCRRRRGRRRYHCLPSSFLSLSPLLWALGLGQVHLAHARAPTGAVLLAPLSCWV